jgi:hydrogenase maturation protease
MGDALPHGRGSEVDRGTVPQVAHRAARVSKRVIGIGNPDRGDDAAGLIAARRAGGIEFTGDALSLLEEWSGGGHFILIDAVKTGAKPGTIHNWDAQDLPPAADHLRSSTHAFSVADAIRLAAATGRLPARLTVIGIEARQFEPGTSPSPEVLAAVDKVVEQLRSNSSA